MQLPINLYVIRNSKKQFYNANRGGWRTELQEARVYSSIGAARAMVTWLCGQGRYGNPGTPEICKLLIGGFEIINEEERVSKVKKDMAKKEAKRRKELAAWEKECAERRLQEAQEELRKLS